jgi:hypothetical protein
MKKVNVVLGLAIFVIAMVFTSCQKENEDPQQGTLVSSSQEDSEVDEIFQEVLDEMDEVSLEEGEGLKSAGLEENPSRVAAMVNNGDGTRTLTITFNSWVNPKGTRVKDGVMVILIEGFYNDANYKRTLTFQNFTVNGHQFFGTKVVERTGQNQFRIRLENCRIDFTDGTSYTRVGERVRTQVQGMETPRFIWDDVYEFTGRYEGVNRAGKSYVHEVIEPLVKRMDWRYMVSGQVRFQVGDEECVIDFGDGTKDNQAEYIRKNNRYRFRMRG